MRLAEAVFRHLHSRRLTFSIAKDKLKQEKEISRWTKVQTLLKESEQDEEPTKVKLNVTASAISRGSKVAMLQLKAMDVFRVEGLRRDVQVKLATVTKIRLRDRDWHGFLRDLQELRGIASL